MNNLIGIHGKMGSGKDLLSDLIQYRIWLLDDIRSNSMVGFDEWKGRLLIKPAYENKKFADIIKDMACMMIGCTRAQLEDRDFKNKPLGDAWNCWMEYHEQGNPLLTLNEPITELRDYNEYRVLTPRILLQLLGTECGREIIHPNIWVNALFAKYNSYSAIGSEYEFEQSRWIITDVRFPNEAKAIKDRGGMLIKIERPRLKLSEHEHSSETALDHYTEWDIVIQNDGTIVELFNKLSKII